MANHNTNEVPTHHDGNTGHDVQQISSMPQGLSEEHVIAGWPSWLTSIIGEIVEGWLPRHANMFKQLDKIIIDHGQLHNTDLGLTTFFDPVRRQTMTSHVITLWYRPPKVLLDTTNYVVVDDLWSTGCILAELLAGKPSTIQEAFFLAPSGRSQLRAQQLRLPLRLQ
jgi:serine/threonine protein kinase